MKKMKHAGEEQIHEQPDEIESRVQLAVVGVCVGLVLDKTCIGAGVAPAAGLDQVGLVDGRMGVGGGQNAVGSVAVPATGGFNVAPQGAKLGVEGVAVGGELFLVAIAADGRGLGAEGGLSGLEDGSGRCGSQSRQGHSCRPWRPPCRGLRSGNRW